VSANDELTLFKRLQVVGVLHACLILIFFILEDFVGVAVMEWWIESDIAKVLVTIFFWLIAPKFVAMLRLKV